MVCNGTGERVLVVGASGATLRDQALEAGSVRQLALGPAGQAWMVLADGHAVSTAGGVDRIHAAPMGPGAPWHGAGRKVSAREGQVLLWSWDEEAFLKPLGPSRVITVRTQRDLGLVRPLGMDVHGRLYIHLETLEGAETLHVRTAVRRVDPDGSHHEISWDPAGFVASAQDITLGDDGTVYRMEATPEGLGIWRYDAPRWQEVTR